MLTTTSIHEDEEGSSSVEFIVLSVLILIPMVYAIVAVHMLQTASYAVAAASDQAARISGSSGMDVSASRSQMVIDETLSDYKIDPSTSSHVAHCFPETCGSPNAEIVTFTVSIQVPVPLFDSVLGNKTTLANISGTASAPISHDKP